MHADVPDVRPFLWKSTLMVVPVRIGGGSRLKIIESLATGCAVVSTAVGAEGLRLTPGEHYLQADDGASMARLILDALDRPELLSKTAELGQQRVRSHYGWPNLAAQMEQVWQQIASEA